MLPSMGFFCMLVQRHVMRLFLLIVCFCGCIQLSEAQCAPVGRSPLTQLFLKEGGEGQLRLKSIFQNGAALQAENPRLVAICLNITLGLFGMHRMYLGTDLVVPVAYTFTIGGGGVLWLVDLVLLITTKDITTFFNNPHMFMWVGSPQQSE